MKKESRTINIVKETLHHKLKSTKNSAHSYENVELKEVSLEELQTRITSVFMETAHKKEKEEMDELHKNIWTVRN